jgi:hypothetical protein
MSSSIEHKPICKLNMKLSHIKPPMKLTMLRTIYSFVSIKSGLHPTMFYFVLNLLSMVATVEVIVIDSVPS